jgi:hypothetical protein
MKFPMIYLTYDPITEFLLPYFLAAVYLAIALYIRAETTPVVIADPVLPERFLEYLEVGAVTPSTPKSKSKQPNNASPKKTPPKVESTQPNNASPKKTPRARKAGSQVSTRKARPLSQPPTENCFV